MAKKKVKTCKHCGREIAKSAKKCPHCGGKNKKALIARPWVWILIILIIGAVAAYGQIKVDSEFKAAMDHYESAVDAYVDCMEDFDITDEETMEEYNEALEEYSEAFEEMNEIDGSNLGAAEYKYYIEVLDRTEEKLDSIE